MHGYSLHVIRGAIPFPDARHKHSDLLASMAHVEINSGLKKVRVGAAKQFYRNLQLVSGRCTCKYDFAANKNNLLFNIKDFPRLRSVLDWLHAKHKVP